MVELFGQDIAQIVADGVAAAGNLQQGTLTKLQDGVSHTFQGFMEVREVRLGDTFVAQTISVVSILGASISDGAVPAVNDVVSLGDFSGALSRLISKDPAAALYEFEVR